MKISWTHHSSHFSKSNGFFFKCLIKYLEGPALCGLFRENITPFPPTPILHVPVITLHTLPICWASPFDSIVMSPIIFVGKINIGRVLQCVRHWLDEGMSITRNWAHILFKRNLSWVSTDLYYTSHRVEYKQIHQSCSQEWGQRVWGKGGCLEEVS